MKRKYNYRFHDPNPPEVLADELLKVFVKIHAPKVEAAIAEAMKAEHEKLISETELKQ